MLQAFIFSSSLDFVLDNVKNMNLEEESSSVWRIHTDVMLCVLKWKLRIDALTRK